MGWKPDQVHKDTQRLPHNALSFDEITSVVKFIENYAKQHAILLPGRIPAYKRGGESIVPTFNWSDYFNVHTIKTALKGIKKMQYFHFSHRFPGQVKVRSESDGTERTL